MIKAIKWLFEYVFAWVFMILFFASLIVLLLSLWSFHLY